MNIQQIEDILLPQGWVQKPNPLAPSNSLHYYKRVNVEPQCYSNKKGIQLHIQFYDQDISENYHLWSINFKAMLQTGEWCEFSFYSLNVSQLKDRLESLSRKLVYAWRSINSTKL
jgi:hypothetical protein